MVKKVELIRRFVGGLFGFSVVAHDAFELLVDELHHVDFAALGQA